MNSTLLMVVGIAAAAINMAGFLPYIRDIFLHKTKPERAMWWIYTVLFGVLWAAQLDAGAKWLLVSTASYVVTSLAIAVLSLKYGYGRFHKRDVLSLAVAALGIILWRLTDNPLLAIAIVAAVDFAGFWLTLYKTWYAPHSETLISWELAFFSTMLSLLSIGSLKFSLVLYPLYAIVADLLLIAIIFYRRPKVAQDSSDA